VPEDPRVESVDLVEPDVLGELDLRPPLAEQVVAALREGDRFQAVYLGPLFSAEKQG
jgi:hypothetical protein